MPIIDDGAPPANDWVFCIGLARSGSTALCRLVSCHPDALLMNEAGLFCYATLMQTSMVRFGSGRFINNAELMAPMRGKGVSACMVREIMEVIRSRVPAHLKLFGDKLGYYAAELCGLATVFPGCRLVAAQRGIWDAVASFMDADWYLGMPRNRELPRSQLARRTYEACRLERVRLAELRGSYHVHVVQFEDMAAHPERTLRALLGYLGLECTPDAYDYEKAISMTRYSQGVGHWERVPEVVALRETLGSQTPSPA